MDSTRSNLDTIALTISDRKVLSRRGNSFGLVTRYIYGTLALGSLVFLAKDFTMAGSFDTRDAWTIFRFFMLISCGLAAAYGAITWYEKNANEAIHHDLRDDVKLRMYGVLIDLDESTESDPTRFSILNRSSGARRDFALYSLIDLYRIRPTRLVGKDVMIEFGPNSGVVLKLEEV